MSSNLSDKPYINLENPDDRQFALEDPRGFLAQIPNGGILDEIQRAPELPSYLQAIVDESAQPGQFILTGSQQFEIINNITQSLAGRTALLKLLPLTLAELTQFKSQHNPVELLYRGFYPRLYEVDLLLEQGAGFYAIEIKAGATVAKDDFKSLLQLTSFFPKHIQGSSVIYAGEKGQKRSDSEVVSFQQLSSPERLPFSGHLGFVDNGTQ